jgi:hypothetical protein
VDGVEGGLGGAEGGALGFAGVLGAAAGGLGDFAGGGEAGTAFEAFGATVEGLGIVDGAAGAPAAPSPDGGDA